MATSTAAGAGSAHSAVPRLSADSPLFATAFKSVDNVLLDCDGVIWRESSAIPGSVEAIASMKAAGKRVFFVSNNSTKSRVDYVAKLQSFGIDAEAEDVVSSSFATAQYLRTALPEGSKAYVVGASGLHTELQLAGFGTLGLDDFDKSFTMKSFTPELLDPAVKAVVVGMDLKLNYFKIAMAKAYLDHAPGCKFVATNTDSTFPGENMFHPGGGVCVRAVETCTRPVDVVVGKPNTVILDIIAGACALDLSRSMMVGDRLNTDVAFGNAKGLTTLLVETGVNSAAEADAKPEGDAERPDFVCGSLADVLPFLL